jgi:tungstate transport system ATP-binding protein
LLQDYKTNNGSSFFPDHPDLPNLEYRRRVSTVFQTPLLLSGTVESNIASGLRFRNFPGKEVYRRVNYWMEMLHISHLAKRKANVLSGGEAQRVSLARAFCLETDLILMDEPFSSLDEPTRIEMIEDLRSILKKTNQTCIYVTHNLEEALTIGDRMGILFNSQIHQIGEVQDVFNHPSSPEAALFIGVENLISGTVIESKNDLLKIQTDLGIIDAVGKFAMGSRVYICLRPEDILLDSENSHKTNIFSRNSIACEVIHVLNQGSFIRVQLKGMSQLSALMTRSLQLKKCI